MTETERKENLAQITSQDLIGEYYQLLECVKYSSVNFG